MRGDLAFAGAIALGPNLPPVAGRGVGVLDALAGPGWGAARGRAGRLVGSGPEGRPAIAASRSCRAVACRRSSRARACKACWSTGCRRPVAAVAAVRVSKRRVCALNRRALARVAQALIPLRQVGPLHRVQFVLGPEKTGQPLDGGGLDDQRLGQGGRLDGCKPTVLGLVHPQNL